LKPSIIAVFPDLVLGGTFPAVSILMSEFSVNAGGAAMSWRCDFG
jgi:hypothetical protein